MAAGSWQPAALAAGSWQLAAGSAGKLLPAACCPLKSGAILQQRRSQHRTLHQSGSGMRKRFRCIVVFTYAYTDGSGPGESPYTPIANDLGKKDGSSSRPIPRPGSGGSIAPGSSGTTRVRPPSVRDACRTCRYKNLPSGAQSTGQPEQIRCAAPPPMGSAYVPARPSGVVITVAIHLRSVDMKRTLPAGYDVTFDRPEPSALICSR